MSCLLFRSPLYKDTMLELKPLKSFDLVEREFGIVREVEEQVLDYYGLCKSRLAYSELVEDSWDELIRPICERGCAEIYEKCVEAELERSLLK